MARKTKFQKVEEQRGWLSWLKSLLDLYSTEKQFVSSKIHRVSHMSMQKWILGHSFSGVNLLLRNLLLDAMISADGKSPGAGSYVPWFIYNQLHPKVHGSRSSSKSYFDATMSLTKSQLAKEIFEKIYEAAGPLTKIVLKQSYENNVVIKYRDSYQFPLALDAQFHRMIGNVELIEQTNPIVIMIEGAPETIGEINSLLQWNHESQRPVLLVARSFPEEISATLATNWVRGSLSVLPMPYGDKIESINLAADLCAITQGELISAHFGDVISASVLNKEKWGEIDKLEWTINGVSLYKDVNVDTHIRRLIDKLKTIEEEEIQKVYRDRILSLSNDALEIWIDKSDEDTIEELDAIIKHYNAFVVSGFIETPIGLIPNCFADAAKESARALRKEILNIGGFLVGVEHDEMVVS